MRLVALTLILSLLLPTVVGAHDEWDLPVYTKCHWDGLNFHCHNGDDDDEELKSDGPSKAEWIAAIVIVGLGITYLVKKSEKDEEEEGKGKKGEKDEKRSFLNERFSLSFQPPKTSDLKAVGAQVKYRF